MFHVGNDIVDLIHPHAKGKIRDTRFLKRVFLPDEENLALADIRPDAMLWALWTGKEAAYKVIQKACPDITSAPRRYKVDFDREETSGKENFSCSGERVLSGTVDTPEGNISLHTLITPDYVHSVALPFTDHAAKDTVFRGVERMPVSDAISSAYESAYVRKAATGHLLRYLNGALGDIEIRRGKGSRGFGPPQVYFQGQPSAIDISLSHDGVFAAFAFTLP